MPSATSTALIILSLAGLILSSYIAYKRARKQKMTCVIGDDCDKVIKSKYGRNFGLANDVVGIIYYAAILVSTIIFLLFPSLLTSFIISARYITIGIAALFSVYLSFVQIAILKELCEYCLGANLINILIFIVLFL